MGGDDHDRLRVAGGATGRARMYNAASGRLIDVFGFAMPNAAFVDDVVVTDHAAYFTDSFAARRFVVPIGHGGRLGYPRVLKVSGDLRIQDGFNLDGIAASCGGALLVDGDGLLRVGRILHVVRKQNEQIAAVKLSEVFDRVARSRGPPTATSTSRPG